MPEEKKTRPRRGRQPKAAAASTSRQRSIKEMFGGTDSQDTDAPAAQGQDVVEVEDAPSVASGELPLEVKAAVPLADVPSEHTETERPAPKELYPIFRKSVEAGPLPPSSPPSSEPEIIHITDDESKLSIPSRPPKPLHPFFSRNANAPAPLSQPPVAQDVQDFVEGSSRDAPIVIGSSPVLQTKVLPKSTKPPKIVHPFFSKPTRTEQHKSTVPQNASVPAYPDRESQHVVASHTHLPALHEVFPRRAPNLQVGACAEDETGSDSLSKWLEGQYSNSTSSHTLSLSASKAEVHTRSTYIDTIPRVQQALPPILRLLQYASAPTWEEGLSIPQQDQWTDRWRPTCAEEVLGNKQHAIYLKDWMDTLRLQHELPLNPVEADTNSKGTKKRKRVKSKKRDIVRHVKKRRRDDYDDDLLAPSDFTESEAEDTPTLASSDVDDFAFCRKMVDRMSATSVPATQDSLRSSPTNDILSDGSEAAFPAIEKAPRFGRQIRNTILLVGPSGSGKTATVYACAKELAWDVFEVYPGIGERSGAELHKLIGDVGKNHIVKVHQSPKKGNPKATFFQPGRGKTKVARRIESDDEMDDIDIISVSPADDAPPAVAEPAEPRVNQSVVLVEEVDILYQTDTNFWPALINIIKECKRPVILTCNGETIFCYSYHLDLTAHPADISRVPCLDLPLQTTLRFAPCPSPLAGSYLQALCLAQGVEVKRQGLIRLYEGEDAQDGPHQPDLRQTIMQLQFLVANVKTHATPSMPDTLLTLSPSEPPIQEIPTDSNGSPPLGGSTASIATDQNKETAILLARMSRVWDSISFADAYLCRENSAHLRDVFSDESGPSPDDLLGYKVLHAQVNTDSCPVSVFYQQDKHIHEEVLALTKQAASERFAEDIPTSKSTKSLDTDRRSYHALVGPVLRNPVSEAPTRPWRASISEEALYLDYAPWIRYIVAADDTLESLSQPSSQGRRSTRNSQRTSQGRWLKLDFDQRRTLSETSLHLE
ncbi:hypothetical protein NM688_g6994 [Phlebia brevispora]|uniref:Uncharacterized protein n=1 Tax=Phlebia brevispora TaxID=194682 RepID=A0ACC1SA93_9APHY|nr:hypothetical protein NM688_g6994 [Phlebia brevispora]